MEVPILQHDVVALNGDILLPGGSSLDHGTCASLSRRQNGRTRGGYPFGDIPGQTGDLREFLANPPYVNIFSDRRETGEILGLMGRVELIEPVIEALEYFREHDFHTYRHSLMVFALSTLLARHLYPDDRSSLLGALAGPSHDLGKICVPTNILRKDTPLTRLEEGILKHHALAGYVLMTYYTGDAGHLTARVARDHHERRDGTGYPRGIDTYDEMLEIVILADMYDALISPRPYRPVSFDNRTALEMLTGMAVRGKIGWLPLKALIAFNRESRPPLDKCELSMDKRGRPPTRNVYGIRAD